MKRREKKIYEVYFALIYSLVYRHYPYNVEAVTVEVFKNRILKAVSDGQIDATKNCIVYVVNETINYCAMRRFEEIYNRYFEVVYGIAFRYHPNEVDDVIAEIFIKKILTAIYNGKFAEDKDYAAYIAVIAIRQCLSIYKRNQSRRTEPIEKLTDSDSSESSSVSSEILDPSLSIGFMIDLMIALEQLSRNQYLVIMMTIEGYPDKEIAEEMNRSVDAVRMLRNRARKKLKKILR